MRGKAAVIAAAAALALAGCGANNRDLEGVDLIDPDRIEVYANVDQNPNIVRLCIDGVAFITTSRKRFAVQRAEYWDGWCAR